MKEYKTLDVGNNNQVAGVGIKNVADWLNKEARDGWTLFQVVANNECIVYVMQREKLHGPAIG